MLTNRTEANRLKEEGNRHYAQENYEKALDLYSQSLAMAQDGSVLTNRALVYLKIGMPANARLDTIEAMQIDRLNGKALYRRAMAEWNSGYHMEALETLGNAIQFYPNISDQLRALNKQIVESLMEKRSQHCANIYDILAVDPDGRFLGVTNPQKRSVSKVRAIESWTEMKKLLEGRTRHLEDVRFHHTVMTHSAVKFFHKINSGIFLGTDYMFDHVDFSILSKEQFNGLFEKSALSRPHSIRCIALDGHLFFPPPSTAPLLKAVRETPLMMYLESDDPYWFPRSKIDTNALLNYLHHYENRHAKMVVSSIYLETSVKQIIKHLFKKFTKDTIGSAYVLEVQIPYSKKLPLEVYGYNEITKERFVVNLMKSEQLQAAASCLSENLPHVNQVVIRRGV